MMPKSFLRSKRRKLKDALDYDYVAKLSPEERAWLEEFSREYYHASPRKEGGLHPTERRREIYGANNARIRDIWNQWDRLPLDVAAYDVVIEEALSGKNKKSGGDDGAD